MMSLATAMVLWAWKNKKPEKLKRWESRECTRPDPHPSPVPLCGPGIRLPGPARRPNPPPVCSCWVAENSGAHSKACQTSAISLSGRWRFPESSRRLRPEPPRAPPRADGAGLTGKARSGGPAGTSGRGPAQSSISNILGRHAGGNGGGGGGRAYEDPAPAQAPERTRGPSAS